MENIPGDTDGKFLSEDTDSTMAVSGVRVGKWKSDTDGKCFSPENWQSTTPSWN